MEQSPLIEFGLPVALAIIMAGMGLTLTADSFRRVIVQPRAMVLGTIAQVVLIPLLAFALIELLEPGPAIAVGLVVIAACPGGSVSNVFTFFAKANLALSITLTVIASLITIVTLPLFVNLALDWYSQMDMEEPLRLPVLRTVVTLIAIVVFPVIVGMIVRARLPEIAARAEAYISRFGLAVLGVLIVVIMVQTRDQILELLLQAGPSVVALNVGGVAAGWLCGPFGGLTREDALTIAIEVGIKNGTVGLLVTLTLLDRPDMAIPSAVYGVMMFALGTALVVHGRHRLRNSPPPEAVEP